MMSAAPIPITARAAISCAGEPDWLATTAITPKITRPTSSAHLRPKRSPSAPAGNSTPAKTSAYDSMIHSDSVEFAPNCLMIVGIATLSELTATTMVTRLMHNTREDRPPSVVDDRVDAVGVGGIGCRRVGRGGGRVRHEARPHGRKGVAEPTGATRHRPTRFHPIPARTAPAIGNRHGQGAVAPYRDHVHNPTEARVTETTTLNAIAAEAVEAHEGLRHGRHAGHRARSREREVRGRPVHRHHGPLGFGQVDAHALPRRPRPAQQRIGVRGRCRSVDARRTRAHEAAARPHRLRVPGLQPDPHALGDREHHAPDGPRRPQAR
jgi:hypothetical protein